jgi:Leucine-rich repeat (LRR) protein
MIVANNDDDDSFGPTPPPPAYPHPDDLGAPAPAPVAVARDDERANTGGNGGAFADGDDEAGLVDVDAGEAGAAGPGGKKNRWKILGFANRRNPTEGGLDNQGGGDGAPNGEVQIQGLEEVLKDDPPAASARDDEEGFGRGRGGGRFGRGGGGGRGGGRADDTDNEVDEDMSVEIPPTTVVQRMEHKEENDYEKRVDNGKWTRMGAIAACILVVLAVILGVGYGTGAFQKSSSPSSSGGGSGGSSDPNRPAAVQSYVQSISTEGDAYFANDTDPGRLASNWLINSDPLQLSPDTPAGKFRLGQRYALLTFWYSSRANWANATGWASADDECAWYGVTCEVAELEGAGQVNVVTEIGMGSNGVQALSSDLFLLNNLKVLSLTDNVIVGPLPPALANASSLVEIDLGANGLQQDLSDFDWTGLVNLEILRLGGNPGLNGTLNDSLWTLVKLQELDLNGCRFSGEVGAAGTVDSLPSLAVFDVSNNRGRNQAGFSGSLPTIFASLPTLQVLGLGGNRFTGAIPTEYGSIPALSELNLADNQLTGGVTRLGTLANLTVLRLGGNAGLGGGNIPTALYDLTSLEALDISSIGYSGAIDPAIANLANLVEFNVSGNSLTGAPPAEMQALASLEVLHMQNNFFSGPLDFAPALGSLVDLNVATNLFTGISDLSVLSKLQYLSAQENQLGSPFPETVASISSLGRYRRITVRSRLNLHHCPQRFHSAP